jgi:hypothetical protein
MSNIIFVIDPGHDDTNISINREISLVNYLMSAYPGTIFLCRGTFLLIELFEPRSPAFWGDQYLHLLDRCDALYCHEANRSHPIADYATDTGLPILDDLIDLEHFLTTQGAS